MAHSPHIPYPKSLKKHDTRRVTTHGPTQFHRAIHWHLLRGPFTKKTYWVPCTDTHNYNLDEIGA